MTDVFEGTNNTPPLDVKTAAAMTTVTKEMIDGTDFDILGMVRSDVIRKIEKIAPKDRWLTMPDITETDEIRIDNVYADDADWDADELPEPIGTVAVPVVLIRASVKFVPSGAFRSDREEQHD